MGKIVVVVAAKTVGKVQLDKVNKANGAKQVSFLEISLFSNKGDAERWVWN